jgi:hypothetical protein
MAAILYNGLGRYEQALQQLRTAHRAPDAGRDRTAQQMLDEIGMRLLPSEPAGSWRPSG